MIEDFSIFWRIDNLKYIKNIKIVSNWLILPRETRFLNLKTRKTDVSEVFFGLFDVQ